MEDGAVFAYHDIGVVAILDVQQVLDQAKARVALRETGEHCFSGVLFA